jgi:predicted glycosyltransferase
MDTPPTILFQPPNHIGLGHINRLAAIALALREMPNPVRPVFVVEGSSHLLLDVLNLPSIPLPSDHAMFETDLWNSWSADERFTLSKEISQGILRTVRPQLVVFDCFPNPQFARVVFEEKIPTILCLREMRDINRYLNHIGDMLGQIGHIILPHDAGALELPDPIRMKSCFVGEIIRFRRKHEAPPKSAERSVVVCGGGGGYPGTVSFYNLAMKALTELQHLRPKVTCRLIAGPLFQYWSKLQLAAGVSVTPFEPDMIGAFSAADLVVSAAGYNACAELEQLGARAILVPAERQWDDQYARARRLAHTYSHFKVFTGPSPQDLANLMHRALEETIDIHMEAPMNGAWRAAEAIRAILERRRPLV